MKKILIVSYYHLKESLLYAANALSEFKYDICNYPLFQYAYDKNDKRSDYLQHFLEYIAESECDVILWWFFGLPANEIQHIRNKTANLMHILYNWDDPHCWQSQKEFGNKCKNFDLVISSSRESDELYYQYGVKRVVYGLPGYSSEIFHPVEIANADKYITDVSFCITNLYETPPNQIINRKKLVDLLAEADLAGRFRFHLYGPDYLGGLYPTCYKGYIQYDDLNQIFNGSRINISTHVVGNADGYVNERTIQILAANGGVCFVDPVKNFPFSSCKKCIIMIANDASRIIEQIEGILANYDNLCNSDSNVDDILQEYTWMKWAERLHRDIARHFFNWRFYKETYNLTMLNSRDELWNHWTANIGNLFDKFATAIPKKFNILKYRDDKELHAKMTDELVYWHWKTVGNEDIKYLVKSNKRIDNNDRAVALIQTEEWRLFHLFSQLSDRTCDTFGILQEIEAIAQSSPYLDMKECLAKYADMVDN